MRRQPLIVILVAVILFGLTSIIPVFYMLGKFVFYACDNPSSLEWMLLDARQWQLLGRSLFLGFFSMGVAFILGFPTAVILASGDMPFRRLGYGLVFITLLIPPYIMTGAWIHLLSPNGMVNRLWASLMGQGAHLNLYSMVGCAWCLGVSYYPIIAIMVAAGLTRLDQELIDISKLYMGPVGVFIYGIFPQIWHHIIASCCLVLIFSLGRYGVPSLLGINTYPVEIFTQFSAFYDDNSAVACSIPLMLIVISLILLQKRIMKSRAYVYWGNTSRIASVIRLKRWKYVGLIGLISICVITTLAPFFSVLIRTQGIVRVVQALRSASDGITTTSFLALLAAILSVIIAWPIAFYLSEFKGRWVDLIDIFCWVPIAIPGTILGLGIIQQSHIVPSLVRADSYGFFLLCAYVGMFSPYSIRIIKASFDHQDRSMIDRAMMDCRNWYQRLIYVDIPIHGPAIASSVIIVMVLVIGELNATVLLVPPGRTTLAVTIDNLLHYGANANASALCIFEALCVIVLVGLFLSIRPISRDQR